MGDFSLRNGGGGMVLTSVGERLCKESEKKRGLRGRGFYNFLQKMGPPLEEGVEK